MLILMVLMWIVVMLMMLLMLLLLRMLLMVRVAQRKSELRVRQEARVWERHGVANGWLNGCMNS